MKGLLHMGRACAVIVATAIVCLPAFTADMPGGKGESWWGQSGATKAPFKDSARSGYWWWPTVAQSNVDDAELWGNRGLVYGDLTQRAEQPDEIPMPVKIVREIPVLNDVLFDFDKAVLKTAGLVIVDRLVAELKAYPEELVQIAGHTCNIGPEEYNDVLSKRRADAIRTYLVDQGVESTRVYAAGYGEERPKVSNDDPESRMQNRRVVFTLVVPEDGEDQQARVDQTD